MSCPYKLAFFTRFEQIKVSLKFLWWGRVLLISGKASGKLPWRSPGTLSSACRCRRRSSRTGSSGGPRPRTGHSAGSPPQEPAGRWTCSRTRRCKVSRSSCCTLGPWPVNSPEVDRRGRPVKSQRKGLGKKTQNSCSVLDGNGKTVHDSWMFLPSLSGSGSAGVGLKLSAFLLIDVSDGLASPDARTSVGDGSRAPGRGAVRSGTADVELQTAAALITPQVWFTLTEIPVPNTNRSTCFRTT